jgi:tetratricopeptide (TPR) repeat protein
MKKQLAVSPPINTLQSPGFIYSMGSTYSPYIIQTITKEQMNSVNYTDKRIKAITEFQQGELSWNDMFKLMKTEGVYSEQTLDDWTAKLKDSLITIQDSTIILTLDTSLIELKLSNKVDNVIFEKLMISLKTDVKRTPLKYLNALNEYFESGKKIQTRLVSKITTIIVKTAYEILTPDNLEKEYTALLYIQFLSKEKKSPSIKKFEKLLSLSRTMQTSKSSCASFKKILSQAENTITQLLALKAKADEWEKEKQEFLDAYTSHFSTMDFIETEFDSYIHQKALFQPLLSLYPGLQKLGDYFDRQEVDNLPPIDANTVTINGDSYQPFELKSTDENDKWNRLFVWSCRKNDSRVFMVIEEALQFDRLHEDSAYISHANKWSAKLASTPYLHNQCLFITSNLVDNNQTFIGNKSFIVSDYIVKNCTKASQKPENSTDTSSTTSASNAPNNQTDTSIAEISAWWKEIKVTNPTPDTLYSHLCNKLFETDFIISEDMISIFLEKTDINSRLKPIFNTLPSHVKFVHDVKQEVTTLITSINNGIDVFDSCCTFMENQQAMSVLPSEKRDLLLTYKKAHEEKTASQTKKNIHTKFVTDFLENTPPTIEALATTTFNFSKLKQLIDPVSFKQYSDSISLLIINHINESVTNDSMENKIKTLKPLLKKYKDVLNDEVKNLIKEIKDIKKAPTVKTPPPRISNFYGLLTILGIGFLVLFQKELTAAIKENKQPFLPVDPDKVTLNNADYSSFKHLDLDLFTRTQPTERVIPETDSYPIDIIALEIHEIETRIFDYGLIKNDFDELKNKELEIYFESKLKWLDEKVDQEEKEGTHYGFKDVKSNLLYTLGLINEAKNDFKTAISYFSHMMEVLPKTDIFIPDLYFNLATLHAKLNLFKKSLHYCSKIKKESASPKLYCNKLHLEAQSHYYSLVTRGPQNINIPFNNDFILNAMTSIKSNIDELKHFKNEGICDLGSDDLETLLENISLGLDMTRTAPT